MFSESHSRFVVSVKPENKEAFEDHFAEDCTYLGKVTNDGKINIHYKKEILTNINQSDLFESWENGLKT